MSATTLLLTGASGVLGHAIREALRGHRVIALTHRHTAAGECIPGDLSLPRLGLDPVTYRRLASTVDSIVHAGAITDFATGAEAVEQVNIRGTAEVIQLARNSGARLVHVSTAFVARADPTVNARGGDAGHAAARPETYLSTKRAAEQLVRDSGVASVIARPSVVIGHSVTGEIIRFQGLHGLMTAVLRNALPLIPVHPHTRVDVIPVDIAAHAIAALVKNPDLTGEYWLTSGAAAPTTADVLRCVLTVADELGIEVTPPRHVAPDMVARLIRPVFIDPLPATLRRRFDDMLAMTRLFADAPAFPSSLGTIPGGPAAIDTATITTAVCASVRYLALDKGMADARISVAA